jgi:cell division protein FtsI (penicillin-binding protein 3)/stage V sporulation protein D (sporulation-specific penicillin-binding protein)
MQHRIRAIWILAVLAGGFTVISFNLIQIQLVQHDKYWRMAVKNHLRPETIQPRRGTIFDSDGYILAQTQQVCDVCLDGKLLDHPADRFAQFAQILQVPAQQLLAGFDPRNRHDYLARNVDDNTIRQLRALKLNSLIIEPHDLRSYPNTELAAHILGYTDTNTGHGLAGMEKEMDKSLSGFPGKKWVELDARNREIAGYQPREMPAIDGYNVTLTIKTAIQHVVEDQLDQIVQTYQPASAYIILMDPHTGEILAMGSRPTFDPNNRQTFQADALPNRCITDMVEPGSIFKIITLAAALNEHAINLATPVFCENGSFYYGGKYLKDDEPNGTLSAMEVLSQSSNIGFAKIALDYLHEDKLYQYASAFGIGQRTGLLGQQGESAGLLRPVDKWSAISITRIPMGQEVAATPLQMAMAMSAIANGGRLVAPQLAKQVTDENGRVVKVYQPRIVRQVISPDTAREVARALEQVTIDGTAKHIHIDGHSFAGKTGTAQKIINGTYSHDKHVASFVGFMPVEDPAFVALVMVDSPKTGENKDYGAEVSAPVFANIAKQVAQIMDIPPDQSVAPALSANNPRAL